MEETKASAKKEREGEGRKRRTRKGEGSEVEERGGRREEARGDPRLLGSSRESESGKEKGGKIN